MRAIEARYRIPDFNMPELNGLEAATRIRNVSPQTELLMLTFDSSDQLIAALSAIGVRGYDLKQDCDSELVRALEALESHRPYFTNCATQIMHERKHLNHTSLQVPSLHDPLTRRECDILRLIAEGNSSREIEELLGISVKFDTLRGITLSLHDDGQSRFE